MHVVEIKKHMYFPLTLLQINVIQSFSTNVSGAVSKYNCELLVCNCVCKNQIGDVNSMYMTQIKNNKQMSMLKIWIFHREKQAPRLVVWKGREGRQENCREIHEIISN